jgi:acetyl esterase
VAKARLSLPNGREGARQGSPTLTQGRGTYPCPMASQQVVVDSVLEESRQFNARLEELLAGMPPVNVLGAVETRRARAEGRSIFPPPQVLPEGRDLAIPGRAGDLGVRVFLPPQVTGVFLFIHGGGWVLGGAGQQDVNLWRIAAEARLAVVSVEYRLAPEHPYPAGPDDCEDAALWLLKRARSEFGTSRLSIGGESAGAHLAVLTLLRLRDRHGVRGAFSAASLVFGCYDMSMTPSQRLWGDRYLVLSAPVMRWFTEQFLPGAGPEQLRSPEISPLYADLAGMPPAQFVVGALDPLLDDSLFMAARWEAAGNESQLLVYPEAVHGFTAFPIQIAESANRARIDFLAKSG